MWQYVRKVGSIVTACHWSHFSIWTASIYIWSKLPISDVHVFYQNAGIPPLFNIYVSDDKLEVLTDLVISKFCWASINLIIFPIDGLWLPLEFMPSSCYANFQIWASCWRIIIRFLNIVGYVDALMDWVSKNSFKIQWTPFSAYSQTQWQRCLTYYQSLRLSESLLWDLNRICWKLLQSDFLLLQSQTPPPPPTLKRVRLLL